VTVRAVHIVEVDKVLFAFREPATILFLHQEFLSPRLNLLFDADTAGYAGSDSVIGAGIAETERLLRL